MKLKRRKANNPPIAWDIEEETLLLDYLKEGSLNLNKLIQVFPNRTKASLRSKVRKLRIKHDLFGNSYREEKENFTLKIAQEASPSIVFDAYAGAGHQSFKWILIAHTVYASEKMKSKQEQFEKTANEYNFKKVSINKQGWILYKNRTKKIFFYTGDAIEAAARLSVNNIKVDLVDLDTCGSTLPTLPTLLVLTKPSHLVITHGEFHSMRFKREDVLRRLLSHKDISHNPLPISVEQMCKELDHAVKAAALRAHNETKDSFWLTLNSETWLGSKFKGMLRRHYSVNRPIATSDCINMLSKSD
jgi:hypothetical protein